MKKSEIKAMVSPALVKASETLVCAMAWEQTVRPIMENVQRNILKEIGGTDAINQDIAKRYPDGVYVPADVVEPKDAWLLSQFNFDIYYQSCQRAIERLKFIVPAGCCPLLCAKSDVIKARWAILRESVNITGIGIDKMPVNKMDDASDMVLKLTVSLGMVRKATVLKKEFAANNPYYKGDLSKLGK